MEKKSIKMQDEIHYSLKELGFNIYRIFVSFSVLPSLHSPIAISKLLTEKLPVAFSVSFYHNNVICFICYSPSKSVVVKGK